MPRQKRQHLKRRKDGRFCCVYHGHQFMGLTEDEAFEKREEFKRQERREGYIRENPTVGQYAERWLPIHKAGVRASTYNENEVHLEKLCAVIGNLYVRDVKPSNVKEVYSTQYLGLSDSYIKHARSLFAALFESAVEDGLLRTNPARSESAKPHKGKTGSHRAITEEERRLIETTATDHRMHAPAIVMLYAGLRPQEVKALRVEDVDFDKGIIHVRNFVHFDGGKYSVSETGKTVKATRDVPLFQPVREVLQGKTGYLYTDKDGEVASHGMWAAAWRSYRHDIEKQINGVRYRWYGKTVVGREQKENGTLPPWKPFTVLPYDLRHSFATWCRDNGVELHTCVEWMGHSDATMIIKIYDEVSDSRSQTEAEILEKMLLNRQNNMQK